MSPPCCASHTAPHRHLCSHCCSREPLPPSLTPSGAQHSPELVLHLLCSTRKAQCCSWLFTTTPSPGKNCPCGFHNQCIYSHSPQSHITPLDHFCSDLPLLLSQRGQQGFPHPQSRGITAPRWEILLSLPQPAPPWSCLPSHRDTLQHRGRARARICSD